MQSIFNSVIGESFTIQSYLICLGGAFICGIISAFASSYKAHVSKSFVVSLILMPAIVSTVITMVNGNIGTGVAVMGAFSLVRFRSVPGKAKDIVSIFMAMTSGLACATGYVGVALVFTLLVCLVMMIASALRLGDEKFMDLHITVPESLSFATAFDEVFDEFAKGHKLLKAKTTNMGSLYKLFYKVELKKDAGQQEFIDKLRCRNGNLEITLCHSFEGSDEL